MFRYALGLLVLSSASFAFVPAASAECVSLVCTHPPSVCTGPEDGKSCVSLVGTPGHFSCNPLDNPCIPVYQLDGQVCVVQSHQENGDWVEDGRICPLP